MDNVSLESNFRHIHFIGIGGISMSGLAETLHRKGLIVTGSDSNESGLIISLRQKGIPVAIGQRPENIDETVDLVVYSAAVKPDNPELKAAVDRNIQAMDRALLMGLMMKSYAYPICVSGTHGKTTTTSMIASILLAGGKDPSINLGGILPAINSNYRIGNSEYFVAESCEYFDSFLKFYPYIGVILNVEPDHLDYFRDLPHIEDSFHKFAQNVHADGALVINADIAGITRLTADLCCEVITFGLHNADWTAVNITFNNDGFAEFDVIYKQKKFFHLKLLLRGEHNVLNSLAAVAAAHSMGIDPSHIITGLQGFSGTKRRFELKGVMDGVTIVDDYAHHPTEIKATLLSAKYTPHNKLYIVFQPHTFTRTLLLKDELIASFDFADCVVLVDIYAARETNAHAIHSKDLVEGIKRRGVNAHYAETFADAEKFFSTHCVQGDLLITMGAGDVYLIGENMLHTDLCTLSTE